MTPEWTVLFIAGPGGVGKTTAARQIGRLLSASVLEADDLWLAMKGAFTPEERPALHTARSRGSLRGPISDLVARQRDVAQLVSSSLGPVIGTHLWRSDRVVVEGVWLTPEFMTRENYSGSAAAGRCRSVVVFEDDPARIREGFFGRGGGVDQWPEEDRVAAGELQAAYARSLQADALARGVPTVDARPIETLVERILAVV